MQRPRIFFATIKERGPLSSKIELETTRWVLVSKQDELKDYYRGFYA
jgi:hypothetical protein